MYKWGRGYRANNGGHELNGTFLIINLPDSRSLRIISRSLFLAMILLALLRFSSKAPLYDPNVELKILPILIHDLMDEDLIGKGHRGFILGTDKFEFLREAGVDLLAGDDFRLKKLGAHQVFDYIYTLSFNGIQQIDGILKDGGLVISSLGVNPSDELRILRNFKIVYLRKFENTVVVAMRKASSNGIAKGKQVFCGITSEKKKAVLNGLEDVYLEPPRRAALGKKSIKFLPDLLKDSLVEYPRRVFISDESNVLDWFYKNYPMRDQEFEVYDMGNKDEESEADWITMIVRPEDYVVMKAEAEVVERMMKDKALCLVDELFLECKNEENGRKRAYWQCLELYGKVRDEGIAVHQWW